MGEMRKTMENWQFCICDPFLKSKDVGDLQLGENKVTAWITWMLMLIVLPCSFGTFCLRSERMTWDALQGTYAFADRDQKSVLFASFAAVLWTSSHIISSYQWTNHPANQLRFGSYFQRGRLDVFFDLFGFHPYTWGKIVWTRFDILHTFTKYFM